MLVGHASATRMSGKRGAARLQEGETRHNSKSEVVSPGAHLDSPDSLVLNAQTFKAVHIDSPQATDSRCRSSKPPSRPQIQHHLMSSAPCAISLLQLEPRAGSQPAI